MRLSDAGLRRRPTKLIYLNDRPPPWLTEDVTRDRSNRLLDLIQDRRPKKYRSIVSLLQAIRKSHSLEC
jgi:hypothetical protein